MPSEITGTTTNQCNLVLLRAISTLAPGHGWQGEQFLKKPWRPVATSVGQLFRKFEIINRLDNECYAPYVADSLKADDSGVSSSWKQIAKGHRSKRQLQNLPQWPTYIKYHHQNSNTVSTNIIFIQFF